MMQAWADYLDELREGGESSLAIRELIRDEALILSLSHGENRGSSPLGSAI